MFVRTVLCAFAMTAALGGVAVGQSAGPAARLGAPVTTEPAPKAVANQAPKIPAKALSKPLPKTAKGAKPDNADFRTIELIGRYINTYRSHPEPQRLPDLFRAMLDLNMLADSETSGLYLGFVGGVLASDPANIQATIVKMFPLPQVHHAAVIKAIAYSGTPEWQAILRQNAERMPGRVVLIDRFVTGTMEPYEKMKLDAGPVPLDVLWGNYFATGAYEPVLRMISVLQWSKDVNDVEKLTIGSMVKWTLATNASTDVELLRLLKTAMKTEPAANQKILTEVILAAETGEVSKIRKEALMAIEQLKIKGPEKTRTTAWWGQAGQIALSFGCIAASALGAPAVIGIPCVIGGAASTAAIKMMTP